jgi:hypothetical protein
LPAPPLLLHSDTAVASFQQCAFHLPTLPCLHNQGWTGADVQVSMRQCWYDTSLVPDNVMRLFSQVIHQCSIEQPATSAEAALGRPSSIIQGGVGSSSGSIGRSTGSEGRVAGASVGPLGAHGAVNPGATPTVPDAADNADAAATLVASSASKKQGQAKGDAAEGSAAASDRGQVSGASKATGKATGIKSKSNRTGHRAGAGADIFAASDQAGAEGTRNSKAGSTSRPSASQHACAHCGATPSPSSSTVPLRVCSGCKAAAGQAAPRYCGTACRDAHWPVHKAACKAARAAAAAAGDAAVAAAVGQMSGGAEWLRLLPPTRE